MTRAGSGGTTRGTAATARRPEHELLRRCAAIADPDPGLLSALLEKELDWPYLLETARKHGVRPLLHWRLRNFAGVVPEPVRDELAGHFQRNAWRNVFLTGELLRVVELLEGHGIATIPFKGPVLASSVYENVALRQFTDLDVLVRRGDARRARDIMLASGYEPYEPWTYVQDFNHEYTLVGREDRVRVDVHGEIFPHSVFPIDPERLWSRRRRISIADREVSSFSPEDLLLVLCIHADSHLWERLVWISDIARLVATSPALDWPALLRVARATGTERIVLVGVTLAHDLLGAPLSNDLAERVSSDAGARSLTREVAARLFEEPPDEVSLDLERTVYQLRSRERLRDRLRLMATPNESDWAMVPLPRSLYAVYYMLRPARVLFKYGIGRLSRLRT